MKVYELTWVPRGWPDDNWQYKSVIVACPIAADLLGWPKKDVKVKVDADPFPGSHHIVIDREALEYGYCDEYPLTIDGVLVEDHYWRVSQIVGMYDFHVGLA